MTYEEQKQKLIQDRGDLISQKERLIEKMSAIKNLIRSSGKMQAAKYKNCCDAQLSHLRALGVIEGKLRKTKEELRQLCDKSHLEYLEKRSDILVPEARESIQSQPEAKAIIFELSALREKYHSFSADHTRVSSMRQMSSEFALELSKIIRKAVSAS